jgi:hypothetical protein
MRSRSVAVPEHLAEDGEPFLDVVAEYGLEGIVAKRRDSPYIPGSRSGDWLKCHVTPRADVVLGGLVEDERRGAIRALCGMYAGDVLAFVGPILVLMPLDLRELGMLGDTGSNAIGAVAGLWLVFTLSTTGLAIAAAIMALVTIYGEFRSISELVDRTPGLRQLDSFGRSHA